jgi:hypothetical protein
MMIRTVDQRNLRTRIPEGLGRSQSTESPSDDHYS